MILIVLSLLSLTLCVTGGPLCFSCSNIQQARYCDYTERCADHQVCHVQKIMTSSGHHVYTSGCLNNATCGTKRSLNHHGDVTCIECCHGDMCNNKGCGDTGPPERQYRGPYCFQCDHMSKPSECEQLTVCELDEECAVTENAFGFFGEHTFSSGCKRKEQCESNQPFGRRYLHRRRVDLCNRCCSGDFCNTDCGQGNTPVNNAGQWLSWGAWSDCPLMGCSDQNVQVRTRTCYNSATQQEVFDCVGSSTQNRTCGHGCTDCKSLYDSGVRRNGIYTIAPSPSFTLDVYCDLEDGGWIVIQNRFNGSVNFTRGWTDYANGFGDLNGEFWLGLNKVYNLTYPNSRKVKFDLKTDQDEILHATYDTFSVESEANSFKLHVSNFMNGTLNQYSFTYNNAKYFATYDRDNIDHCGKIDTGVGGTQTVHT